MTHFLLKDKEMMLLRLKLKDPNFSVLQESLNTIIDIRTRLQKAVTIQKILEAASQDAFVSNSKTV